MYRRLLITVCPFVLLLLVASSCATRGRETGYSLEAIARSADQLATCQEAFADRIAESLAGVALPKEGGRDNIALTILLSLPYQERRVFGVAGVSLPPEASRELTVSFLRQAFSGIHICGASVPESKVDLFADSLNAYLVDRGIATGLVFRAGGAPTMGRETQAEMLYSLVAASRAR